MGVASQYIVGDLIGQSQTVDEGDLGGGIRPGGIGSEEDTVRGVIPKDIGAESAPLGRAGTADGAE